MVAWLNKVLYKVTRSLNPLAYTEYERLFQLGYYRNTRLLCAPGNALSRPSSWASAYNMGSILHCIQWKYLSIAERMILRMSRAYETQYGPGLTSSMYGGDEKCTQNSSWKAQSVLKALGYLVWLTKLYIVILLGYLHLSTILTNTISTASNLF